MVAPTHRFGVVVTADCDLAQRKNRNSIAYVPVLSSPEYCRQLAGPKRLAELLDRQFERFLGDFRSFLPTGMSKLDLRDWCANLSPEEAWRACGSVSSAPPNRFLTSFAAIRLACALPLGADIGELASAIAGLKLLDSKKVDARSELEKIVREEILPSDIYYLPAVSDAHSGGYFVYLRAIISLTQDSLSLVASPWDQGVSARRISRLEPFLRFALLQSLSMLFVRVGVHDSFRDRSNAEVWVEHEID
jgi:hypothetical protein